MFTDTHCHLASKEFHNIEEIVQKAQNAGIHRIIAVGTTLQDSIKCVKLAESFPQVFATVGIHPCYITEHSLGKNLKEIEKLLSHPKVLALGEIGLDFYHPAPKNWNQADYLKLQEEFFVQQLALASTQQINVIIHTREEMHQTKSPCFHRAFEILQTFSNISAVFHCWVLSEKEMLRCLDNGHYISFTGISTFPKNPCKKSIQKCAKKFFMLETDSPYLAPHPHRGKTNEPAFVKYIAEKIAEERNESLEELSQHTENCVKNFYSKIPPKALLK